jgi:hypothetical protein
MPVNPDPPKPPDKPHSKKKALEIKHIKKLKKIEWTEIIMVSVCLLFAVIMSLYHISYGGYLGISERTWNVIWAIAQDSFSVALCLIISLLSVDMMRLVFRWVFIPYFLLKFIYDFSCFSGNYFLEKSTWVDIWSVVVVVIILIGAIFCLIKINSDVVK